MHGLDFKYFSYEYEFREWYYRERTTYALDRNLANDLNLDQAIRIGDENLMTNFNKHLFYIKRSRCLYMIIVADKMDGIKLVPARSSNQ